MREFYGCYDLDGTLGDFLVPDDPASGLREGAATVLSQQRDLGVMHALTTSAGKERAIKILETAGIREYFQAVFSGEEISVGTGKLYQPAAARFGLSPEAAQNRLFVTGDTLDDQPLDLDNTVFLFHPRGYRYKMTILSDLTSLLGDCGRGSFLEGFRHLYTLGDRYFTARHPLPAFSNCPVRILRLFSGNAVAALGFRTAGAKGKEGERYRDLGYRITIPTLHVVEADGYLTKTWLAV